MNHDAMMWRAIDGRPNMLVPLYILASYAYYHLDRPVLSDGAFDELALALLANWSAIDHRHKHLITLDAVRAGTLLLDEADYPGMAKGAARDLIAALDGAQNSKSSIMMAVYRSLLPA